MANSLVGVITSARIFFLFGAEIGVSPLNLDVSPNSSIKSDKRGIPKHNVFPDP